MTRFDGCTSAHVALTVASVGPYVLRNLRPGRCQRSTSSWGHDSPDDEQEADPGNVLVQGGQQGGHAAQRGDPLVREELMQLRADQAGRAGLRNECRTGHPGNPDLLDREVEGHGEALVDTVGALDSVHLRRHTNEVADARVPDRHALRPAGRPRGVDHVGEIVAGLLDFSEAETLSGFGGDRARELVQGEHPGRLLELGEPVRHGSLGEDHLHSRVLNDEGEPVGRRPGVERNVGRVKLEDGEHARVAVGRLVEEQADAVTGADPMLTVEMARQPVGTLLELGVRQPAGRPVDRDRLSASLLDELVAVRFEELLEPLARLPADRAGSFHGSEDLGFLLSIVPRSRLWAHWTAHRPHPMESEADSRPASSCPNKARPSPT